MRLNSITGIVSTGRRSSNRAWLSISGLCGTVHRRLSISGVGCLVGIRIIAIISAIGDLVVVSHGNSSGCGNSCCGIVIIAGNNKTYKYYQEYI